MILRRFVEPQLAQMSYLIGCRETRTAIVIDPIRDAGMYIEAAAAANLKITHVTETHIHADYISGTRELAARTGAQMLLSNEGPPNWRYDFAEESSATLLRDGDMFDVGKVRFKVKHTPGHTPEHLSFIVKALDTADEPVGVLTGDFVFVSDVGRPDLLERAADEAGTKEASARLLYLSLSRIRKLPDYLQIWPAHGAGSACGKALGDMPSSTVGYERLANWAFVGTRRRQVRRQGARGAAGAARVLRRDEAHQSRWTAHTRRPRGATVARAGVARSAGTRGRARRRCPCAGSFRPRARAGHAQHSVGRLVHDARGLAAPLRPRYLPARGRPDHGSRGRASAHDDRAG